MMTGLSGCTSQGGGHGEIPPGEELLRFASPAGKALSVNRARHAKLVPGAGFEPTISPLCEVIFNLAALSPLRAPNERLAEGFRRFGPLSYPGTEMLCRRDLGLNPLAKERSSAF